MFSKTIKQAFIKQMIYNFNQLVRKKKLETFTNKISEIMLKNKHINSPSY